MAQPQQEMMHVNPSTSLQMCATLGCRLVRTATLRPPSQPCTLPLCEWLRRWCAQCSALWGLLPTLLPVAHERAHTKILRYDSNARP